MTKPLILCVDDDITILLSLKAQLKYTFGARFDYEVAESAREAWEVLEEMERRDQDLAVVISDWLMPETKGDAFLIDVHARYPDSMKLMLTGHVENEAVQRAKHKAGLTACLTKPWQKDELVALISQAVEA